MKSVLAKSGFRLLNGDRLVLRLAFCAIALASLRCNYAVASGDDSFAQLYITQVQNALRKFWQPPEGTSYREIHVYFDVDRHGKASNIQVKTSCGDALYDKAAIEAVRRAQPFPIPPNQLTGATIPLDIGIAYVPKNKTPERAEARRLFREAEGLMTSGDKAGAIAKLQQSMRADPSYRDPRKRLAFIYLDEARFEKDSSVALPLMHKVMTLAPEEDVYGRMDALIRKLGKDPGSFSDRVSLGDEARQSGDWPGAVYEYTAALKLKQDDGVQKKLDDTLSQHHN